MAVYNAWTVEYLNGSTWTAISNVQDLSCQVGRQTAVDQWPVSQASMRIWYPSGYTSPLANLTIGTYIRFFAPGRSSTKPSWTGLVQNVTVEVGIPWNSGTSTGNGDFLVIDCEGALSVAGRANEFTSTGGPFAGELQFWFIFLMDKALVNYALGGYVGEYRYGDTPVNYKVNPGQGVQEVATLSTTKLLDGVRRQAVDWIGPGTTNDPGVYLGETSGKPSVVTVGFSDTTNNATNRIYTDLAFDGLADQYYTQSQLSYESNSGGGIVEANSASSPIRTFSSSIPPQSTTIPASTTASATWYANAFNPPDIGISSISATTAGQHTQNLDTLGVTDLELGYLPLYVVPVTLRGTTYYCQIEGVSVTADTNQARFTYYVTPTDTTAWFTLDSSTFGVLDQNRLGIY